MIASADGEAPAVYFSRLVSNGALLQLLACLALASARSDPYVVGPIIALYAARESDRRALFLYLVVTAIAGLFELMFLLQGHPSDVWESLEVAFRLLLKVAMLYPSLKLHDLLPATRPPRVQPDQLKEQMAVVVQQVLREQIDRLQSAPSAPPKYAAVSQKATNDATAVSTHDTSWDEV